MAGSAFGEIQGEFATTDERQRQRAAQREQDLRQMAQNLRRRAGVVELGVLQQGHVVVSAADRAYSEQLRSRAQALDQRADEIQRRGTLYQPGEFLPSAQGFAYGEEQEQRARHLPYTAANRWVTRGEELGRGFASGTGLAQPPRRPGRPKVSDHDVSICQGAVGSYNVTDHAYLLVADLSDVRNELREAERLRAHFPKVPRSSECAEQRAANQFSRSFGTVGLIGEDLELLTLWVPRNDIDRVNSKLGQLEVDLRSVPEGELPTLTGADILMDRAQEIRGMVDMAVSRGIANCIASSMGGG
ncbi:MAG: hypothetical protein KGJ23_08380 [Euryarchaeota archaeon]|nr:hypothetical protein [Euryarchaeota archaeon]MDE1836619.1 hypothetical protein [Euryarchaeota archaeon]MDE1879186.1 hypothetical protein [Euryarchaeota archaeon]MDE2044589.1 hypothetical protein [Thermoplasmata archaeon]